MDVSKRHFLIALASTGFLVTAGMLPPLHPAAAASSPIEREIEKHIKGLRRQGVIGADEKTAWSVYDFTTQEKRVSINEDTPYQSASMIKPFIALAFFYRVKENQLAYTRERKAMLEAMMQKSNNGVTNAIIDLLSDAENGHDGPEQIERIIKNYAPGVFQQTRIVERIPGNGRTYKNQASARDYSRFLYALWNDHFPYSDELKRLMNLPNKDRIRTGRMASGVDVYDKTGTTSRLCGNMGIVLAPGKNGMYYPYTFIGIIEKSRRSKNFSRWVGSRSKVIREVSAIVYGHLQDVYDLA